MSSLKRAVQGNAVLVLILVVVAWVYYPGLSGGYVFDDEVNILQAKQLRLKSLSADDLRAAALSGNAGPLGRPIALLSFALNLYSTGDDPYYFKLTNLLIHLGNTFIVALLATTLYRALIPERTNSSAESNQWFGWLTAALWGLHPLNLTSVLYVVQRMTSLSALFGLCALLLYARLRARQVETGSFSPWRTAFASLTIVLLLTASALSKESGLLFVPLLLWIEHLGFGFRLGQTPIRIGRVTLQQVVSALLVLGIGVALYSVLPRMLGAGAYANRDFTLQERALTETRVLMYYLRLLALPRSTELSLYHDDFRISERLFDPPSTAISVLALLALSYAALYWRKAFPLALFGWGWFLISHSLESTIFPLELVHEHRNYFASVGLLMAVPVAIDRVWSKWRNLALTLIAAYVAFLGFVTFTRAEQWSSYVDLAVLEASNHPNSARANYELGRTYLALFESTGEQRFGPLADEALRAAIKSYRPGLASYFGLVQTAYYRGLEPDPDVVLALKNGLRTLPFYNGNSVFLQSFMLCQIDRRCSMPDREAISIFTAALENPRIPRATKAEVYKQLAQYYIGRLNDLDGGLNLIGDAIAVHDDASTRIMLAQAFGMKGEFDKASDQLKRAAVLDRSRIYGELIERERVALARAVEGK